MAGIGDQCSNRGVKKFTQQLSSFSGAEGYCVYVGITFILISLACIKKLFSIVFLFPSIC